MSELRRPFISKRRKTRDFSTSEDGDDDDDDDDLGEIGGKREVMDSLQNKLKRGRNERQKASNAMGVNKKKQRCVVCEKRGFVFSSNSICGRKNDKNANKITGAGVWVRLSVSFRDD